MYLLEVNYGVRLEGAEILVHTLDFRTNPFTTGLNRPFPWLQSVGDLPAMCVHQFEPCVVEVVWARDIDSSPLWTTSTFNSGFVKNHKSRCNSSLIKRLGGSCSSLCVLQWMMILGRR